MTIWYPRWRYVYLQIRLIRRIIHFGAHDLCHDLSFCHFECKSFGVNGLRGFVTDFVTTVERVGEWGGEGRGKSKYSYIYINNYNNIYIYLSLTAISHTTRL